MTVISEEYRALNRQLHADRKDYGAGNQTAQWYPIVAQFAQVMGANAVLDYGAGKGKMGQAIAPMMVIPYDPAVPGMDDPPEPQDVVVSLDVLEHIEPDLLDNVLDDMQRCALKGVFLTINMRPAYKTLADGRNAHLIQKPIDWWLPKLMQRWDLLGVTKRGNIEFVFTGANLEIAKARAEAA
jgi:hypothetical protein